MKIPYFFILTACATAGNVFAAPPRQPPVLDSTPYNDATSVLPATRPAPSYDENANLERLQNDLTELRNKVQEQDDAITNLRHTNNELQKKLTGSHKTAGVEPKTSAIDDSIPSLEQSAKPATKKTDAVVDSEKSQYQHGTALLKKNDYAGAISAFKEFIAEHPNSEYADNAQYWIATALLKKGDKKGAIQAFDHVARTYPQSEKTPEALFKLGDTLLGMNNKVKAKEYFDYVIANHPGTEGAKLAAKKKAAAKL